MKLRRKIGLMLAIMLSFSLVPSFARLTGEVVQASEFQYSWMSNIVKVSNDSELKLGSAPVVTIKEDFGVWEKDHSIYLTVSNSEWADTIFDDDVIDVRDRDGKVVVSETGEKLFHITRDGTRTIAITKKTSEDVPFMLRIPMLVNIDDRAKDDIVLKIEGESTGVRDAEHVFATVSDSKINIRFNEKDDMVKFATRGTTLNPIRIEENFVGALKKGDQIKFDISRDFEWNNDYTTGPAISIRGGADGVFSLKYDRRKSDETVMVVEVDNIDSNRTRRISFEINDLNIITEERNSTDYGKVEVNISGKDIEDKSIIVAEYVDYGAESSVKEKGEFFSGRKITLPVITLQESVRDSVRFDRPIDIDFPQWVNVIGIKSAKLDGVDVTTEFEEGFDLNKERLDKEGKDKEIVYSGTVRFEPKSTSKAIKLEVEFIIETKANAKGDIDVEFSGRAFDKSDIVQTVGNVKPVIEVTADKTNLNVGFKDQKVGNIYIKETEKDAIQKGYMLIQIDDFMHGRWDKEPVVKVTEGDIRIGEIKLIDNETLSIEIRSTSRKLSTIEISEVIMTTNRAVADGVYDINVFGNAIIDKGLQGSDWEKGYDSPYITIGEQYEEKEKISFVIGQSIYTAGEEKINMDAAPYIDENGRTMVPVRYVAEAIGVLQQNILWSDRTVTIFTPKNQIVQVKIDTPIITINGASIQMDTQAVINDNRTYLPISWIARVLDIPYTWEGNTKTVTFN
ncbi:MAG TPA: copper amine oxidase N-terminal domain-containing protein [Clostridiales bacterium]|nr:copper amine oxidase N-terminal domain-containing protein [Clostridiales bacterium]